MIKRQNTKIRQEQIKQAALSILFTNSMKNLLTSRLAQMSGKFKIIIKYIALLLILSSASLNAQLLQDTTALTLVKKDIDYIYNLKFNNAREVYTRISQLYPAHPIVFLLRGIIIYWENYPMTSASPAVVSFEDDMNQSIRLSEKNDNPDYDAEYLLADLCARGMLLSFYADNNLTMKVIPLTTGTYKYLKHAMNLTSPISDLYYFTGLYKYYREAYPEIHPIYKSLAFMLMHGDTKTGLKELQIASEKSVLLRADSYLTLTGIYSGFENKYSEALYYSKSLYELYPDNVLYLATYIKNLLLMKQYDEAEYLITASSEEAGNNFSRAQLIILKGIIQEKKYRDNNLAMQYYNNGILNISNFGRYGNEYAAYAYFGLSRINKTTGDKQASMKYWKIAMKLASFKSINFDN